MSSIAVQRTMEALEVFAVKARDHKDTPQEIEKTAIDITQAILVLTKSDLERQKVLAS